MTECPPCPSVPTVLAVTIACAAAGPARAQSADPLWEGYRDGAVRCQDFMKTGDFSGFPDKPEVTTDLDDFTVDGFREVTWVSPDALIRVRAFQNDLDDPRRRGCGVMFNYRNPYAEPNPIATKFDDWLAEDARWSGLGRTEFVIDVPEPGKLLAAYSDCAAAPAPLLVFVTDFEDGPPHWLHFLEISSEACLANSMEAN